MSTDDRRPRRRKLSDEERTLWGRVTRSIAPLRRRPLPAEPAETAGRSNPSPAARAEAEAHNATPAPKSTPKSQSKSQSKSVPKPAPRLEPLDRRQKQRLARGSVPLDARIDLHGRSQSEAHAALLHFLRAAQRDGARFVLVITGKGARARDDSSERGVLKRQVPLWLRLPEFRGYVVGFEDAHIGHGGEGALYVRLRRARTGQ
jgi:DNA-nicking Smr family endonuclease